MLQEFNPFIDQVVSDYFVGREDQLRLFRGSLSGLSARIPSHMYVVGEAGSGKTYYLAKIVEVARANGFLAVRASLDLEEGPQSAHKQITTILRSLVIGIEEHLSGSGQSHLLSDFDSAENSKYFYQPRIDQLSATRVRQDFETIAGIMRDARIPGAMVCIDEGQRIHGCTMSVLKNALRLLTSFLIILSLRLMIGSDDPETKGRDFLNVKATDEADGDMGASWFYVTGIPLGPFETEQDAVDCIKRRLVTNIIQFDDEVIARIARIAGRFPRNLVSLGNRVYAEASKNAVQLVNVEIFEKIISSRRET